MMVMWLCSQIATAQVNSVLGRFTVDIDRGCTGMTLNLTINEPVDDTFIEPRFHYEGFDYTVDPPPGGDTNLSHIYSTSGEYYLTMFVNNDDLPEGQKDSLLITVVNNEIPEFIIHNCNTHNVRVEITEDYYDQYMVDFTATDSETVDPLSFSNEFDYLVQGNYNISVKGLLVDGNNDFCGTANQSINTINQITIPEITSVETTNNGPSGSIQLVHSLGSDIIYNLSRSTNGSTDFVQLGAVTGPQTDDIAVDTKNSYLCYQINTYDACNEVDLPSNIVCSVVFSVQSSDDGNLLTWKTDTTIAQSYNILRDNNLLVNITPSTEISYVDTAVICKKQYIYNVQSLFGNGSSIAIDTAVIANQSGILPRITKNPGSTVLNNQVVLDWGPPDTGEIPFRKYLIEKNINNRGWLSSGSTIDTTYTDQNATFVGTHSYRISYDDECGNIAKGSPSTDPLIIQQISARGRIVTYRWNRYENWLQGIRSYVLERVDSAGNVLAEYPVLSGREKNITFDGNDLVNKFIRVRAESLDDSPKFSHSNVILTQLATEMYLPTAFTPDGDNLNDKFVAKGPSVFNFRMEIYNRWGVLIFGTDDNINGWDGLIKGENSPEGTYIYKIFFEDGEGRQFDQSGAFTLLRQR